MLCCVLVLPVYAEDAALEARAKKAYDGYLSLRHKENYTKARLRYLRTLGSLDTGKARTALLRVLKTTRSKDEKVVCLLGLGKIADVEAAQGAFNYLGRKADPVLTVAFAGGFGRTKNADVMTWLGGDALKAAKPDQLRAAAEALVSARVPEAAPRLVELYGRNAGSLSGLDVAASVVRALGALEPTDETRAVLEQSAKHKDSRLRLAAADVLGMKQTDAALVAKLLPLLGDSSSTVRRVAAASCADSRIEAAVPALIDTLERDPRLRNRHEAYLALKKISGKDYSLDAGGWRRWFQNRNAEPGAAAREGSVSVARYYGFSVYSDRVVFICDLSGSMNWPFRPGKRPKRIEVARKELRGVLTQLSKKTLFNIITYSNKVRSWKKAEVEASPKNVQAALKWVDRTFEEPSGDTYTYDALRKAFHRNPHFDTIYLLSDGSPSDGEHVCPEGILHAVRVMNRDRRAAVHTVALTLESVDRGMPILAEKLREMKAFMKELARSTGGSSRIVTKAPVYK